jgi:hypothetical protein
MLVLDLDRHQLTGQRTLDEHDPPVGLASHPVAADGDPGDTQGGRRGRHDLTLG